MEFYENAIDNTEITILIQQYLCTYILYPSIAHTTLNKTYFGSLRNREMERT